MMARIQPRHTDLKSWARFLERWLSLTQDKAKFQAQFSRLRTCNLRLQNNVEPLLRDTVMIRQTVTLRNA